MKKLHGVFLIIRGNLNCIPMPEFLLIAVFTLLLVQGVYPQTPTEKARLKLCTWPRTYTLRTFDPQFAFDEKAILDLLSAAEKEIEEKTGVDMLTYTTSAEADVSVDMVFSPLQEWAENPSDQALQAKANTSPLVLKSDGETPIEYSIARTFYRDSHIELYMATKAKTLQSTFEHEFIHVLGFMHHLEDKDVLMNRIGGPEMTDKDVEALLNACHK